MERIFWGVLWVFFLTHLTLQRIPLMMSLFPFVLGYSLCMLQTSLCQSDNCVLGSLMWFLVVNCIIILSALQPGAVIPPWNNLLFTVFSADLLLISEPNQ